ncbi:MAG: hypothetical protein Q8O42_02180 [Acidobacteriota bacterium]|nr:hypothetical protein [Acidobacteriota bacterium]
MAVESEWRSNLALAAILALVLGAVAFGLSPDYVTDRDTYEQVGRQLIIPDCSNLHCTRVLVAWAIEQLPGDSILKWKTYAVLGNLLAAWGIFALSRRFGLDASASRAAAVMSALGPGAQLTALDPHTSDPLIYGVVPWLVLLLLDGRFAVVTACAVVGVWAKEFAVAPLWIFAVFGGLLRRTDIVLKSAAGAALGSAAWVGQQLWFILAYNYNYGGNSSARILEGGYLLTWIRWIGPVQAIGAMVLHFGPLAWLVAAGFRRSQRELKLLALASAPAALVFAYVQQPDRAIWNFQFVLLPLAAATFQGAPLWLRATWLTAFAISQLPIDGGWRTALVWTGFAICAGSGVLLARVGHRRSHHADQTVAPVPPIAGRLPRAWRLAAAASAALVAVALVAAGDVALHRRVESAAGYNVWGYRGPVVRHGDLRVLVLGGRHVLGRQYVPSLPFKLQDMLNNERLRGDAGYTSSGRLVAVNLGEPADAVLSMRQTLRDAEYLRPVVVCLYIGGEAPSPDSARTQGWRRRSWIYRATGYLPALPSLIVPGYWPSPADWDDKPEGLSPQDEGLSQQEYGAALEAAIVDARRYSSVLVATHPRVSAGESVRQDAVATSLRGRFGNDPGFEHLDLRKVVDLSAPVEDDRVAESLSQAVFRLLKAR